MRITNEGESSTVTIEDYGDLLAVRALSEWQFIGPSTVRTQTANLAAAGLAEVPPAVEWDELAPHLFDYQRWIVETALAKGRFAIFADTGMGKTAMQLEWARQVHKAHGGRVLVVAPLQVVPQTIDEAGRFYSDFPVADLRDRASLDRWLLTGEGVGVTNTEKLDGATTPWALTGVVIDESSVLKSSMGARRSAIIAACRGVRFKLCCSATPAPNDRVEYAEHAYFLDVVRSTREFLAAFFVNRDGEWQLKRHGRDAFYRHLASWSVFMRSPARYGFAATVALPPMEVRYPEVDLSLEQQEGAREWEVGDQPSLLGAQPGGVTSRTKMAQIANGFLLSDGKVVGRFPSNKPTTIARLVNEDHGDEQVIVWVAFDVEADQLAALIPDAVVLSGKTARTQRDVMIDQFRRGNGPRVLICKASMFGFGLNLQSCRVQVFSTLSDSFERFYQAVRRSHRFGQTRPVVVYVPLTPLDMAFRSNVMAKQAVWEEDAGAQEDAYIAILRPRDSSERRTFVTLPKAEIARESGESWTMVHGDSIAHMPTMADESVDLAIFSPPFANLFTYSSEAADMGNVKSNEEYRLQWQFFTRELFRVIRPGRIVALHCMDVIRFAGQHGYRHTYDYPSDLRAGMEEAGFLYRARISIDKNPQIQATRTKDANLLFATLKRNALDSHPQASECLLVFSRPGTPETTVQADDVSNQEWIRWAHHIWYDIRETDVLNAALGKAADDERHICPLQLGLIERCIRLWTNRGEVVFSPFAGIGSEGYEALSWGRRFYGVELKDSYFETACRFLADKENEVRSVRSLFDTVDQPG